MSTLYIPPSVAELIDNEEWAFYHQFGRSPDQFDPVFFDPDQDEIPLPMSADRVKVYLQELGQRLEMKPSHLYGFFCAAREPDPKRRWLVYSDAIEHFHFLNRRKQ